MNPIPAARSEDDVSCWLAARRLCGRVGGVERLAGGASQRRYFRAEARDRVGSLVVMALPRGIASEELGRGGGAAGEDFVAMARWLAACGVSVPALIDIDLDAGMIAIEDLGDERLFDRVRAQPDDTEALYRQAIDFLVDFQARVAAGPATSPAHTRRFGLETLAAEFEHFVEFGLQAPLGRSLTGAERSVLAPVFTDVAERLAATPYALAHRDFQSQNLMLTPCGLVLLDFQDALDAPLVYDLVALLRDSYVVLAAELLERLLDHYHGRRAALGLPGDPLGDRRELGRLFMLQTIERKLKDAGRFEFIARVKGNPAFLPYFGASVRYADAALGAIPEYAEARALLRRLVPALGEQPR